MTPTLPNARHLALARPLLRATSTTSSAISRTTALRSLSTTPPLFYKQTKVPGSSLRIPSPTANAPEIPLYPYGERQFYKQSNMGLYGSQRIRFGNNVSSDHGIRTRRKWKPNVHSKRLWSESLGTFVRTRVTTRVLRTIDKQGGLDEYLLKTKTARIKDLGPWGWRLRWRIMQTPAIKARFAAEREALGLPRLEEAEAERERIEIMAKEAETMMAEEGMESWNPEDAQVQGMLASEEEFALGEDLEVNETRDDGFMREEKPRKE